MANTNPLILKYRRKVAELGQLDNEINKLDMTLPEGEGEKTFDYLAQKRTEIEEEIKGMQEKVQFLTAWGRFKEGPWSEALKSELDGLDDNIGEIATSNAAPTDEPLTEAGLPAPPKATSPNEPPLPEAGPEVPPEPSPTEDFPPEAPPAEASPEPLVGPEGTSEVPPEPPPAPPTPMQASKKHNYPSSNKKGNTSPNSERGKIMANDTKTSLKEKLADLKQNRAVISREAKMRVAAAWTIAKTMLPSAPVEAQKAFAASLLNNKTSALKAALKQTAVNAHYTKVAETFKEVHKVEMNDLLENPSVLSEAKNAVKSEVKGEAKNATPKSADDRKDAGPQTPTYNDGRGHGGGTASEPKEVDAGKAAERPGAGERPGDTVDLSEGKSAGKKAAVCPNCKGGKMCSKCAAKAAAAKSKKAEFPPAAGAPPAAPPVDAGAPPVDAGVPPVDAGAPPVEEGIPGEEPPMDMPPADGLPPAGPEGGMGGEAEATEMVTEEKIKELGEKAQELSDEIQALVQDVNAEEAEGEEVPGGVLETEGEELEEIGEGLEGEAEVVEGEGESLEGEGDEQALDLDQIFNEESMGEKQSALANESDNSGSEFFAPSAAMDMEATLDDNGVQEFGDVVAAMFSRQGADDDPLAALMGGVRTAAQVAGMEVVPSFTGEAAKHFEQSETSKEARDSESDHSDDLWADTIKIVEPEDSEQKRTPQDAVPELKEPAEGKAPESQGKAAGRAAAKPAAKKPATLRKIKPIIASDKDAPKNFDPAKALFADDFE